MMAKLIPNLEASTETHAGLPVLAQLFAASQSSCTIVARACKLDLINLNANFAISSFCNSEIGTGDFALKYFLKGAAFTENSLM